MMGSNAYSILNVLILTLIVDINDCRSYSQHSLAVSTSISIAILLAAASCSKAYTPKPNPEPWQSERGAAWGAAAFGTEFGSPEHCLHLASTTKGALSAFC